MSEFQVMVRDKYRPREWKAKTTHPSRKEAERAGFALVQGDETSVAIVIETQPVVVSRIGFNEAKQIVVSWPNAVMGEDYS